MPVAPVLIACVGNIFLGDDAFGVEVAKRLSGRRFPDGVRLVDFGIRSFDLTYALLDGYDVTILVDAISRGGKPGTLYVIEPDLNELEDQDNAPLDAHLMDPVRVLRMARSMGGLLGKVFVVGCEPESFGGDEGRMGLSQPVAAVLDEAVGLIESLARTSLETLNQTATKSRNGRSSHGQ